MQNSQTRRFSLGVDTREAIGRLPLRMQATDAELEAEVQGAHRQFSDAMAAGAVREELESLLNAAGERQWQVMGNVYRDLLKCPMPHRRTASTMNFRTLTSIVAKLLAAGMLFWALGGTATQHTSHSAAHRRAAYAHATSASHGYDYYVLLRWVVCGVVAFASFRASEAGRKGWMWTLAIVALFFESHYPRSPDARNLGTH